MSPSPPYMLKSNLLIFPLWFPSIKWQELVFMAYWSFSRKMKTTPCVEPQSVAIVNAPISLLVACDIVAERMYIEIEKNIKLVSPPKCTINYVE